MSQLSLYPLPYTGQEPPPELFRDIVTVSGRSDSTTFDTGVSDRDVFLGRRGCVVCGEVIPQVLEYAHVIGSSDHEAWQLLRRLGWVPAGIKNSPGHEPRNGLTMCVNHQVLFENWRFFIRFQPVTQKYICIVYDSYGSSRSLQGLHGKAIGLDINHEQAPLPLLLLVHEYMTRGRNFFQSSTNLEVGGSWQDWLLNRGVVNEKSDGTYTFNRKAPPSAHGFRQSRLQESSGPSGSGTVMPPTDDLVEELLASQRTMPSWKAWQREGMGWGGTAEENVVKYVEKIGVDEVAE